MAVTVNVTTGSGKATGMNGGNTPGSFSGIENITGGSGINTITGDDNNNILAGGPSDDILVGGLGDDTYLFYDNWGNDFVQEEPGQGNDTIDFSNVTVSITFTFDGSTFSATDGGANTVSSQTSGDGNNYVENFIGGPTDDSFEFKDGAAVAGSVDGGLGFDTLDYSSYDSGRNFVLTALGTDNGGPLHVRHRRVSRRRELRRQPGRSQPLRGRRE